MKKTKTVNPLILACQSWWRTDVIASFATLKNILDDLLRKNTSEEIKIEETLENTLAQKYVEEVKLHFNKQIPSMKFYMEKRLN